MRRVIETTVALLVAIAVPTALLWLVGMSFGALQEASFWHSWPEEAIGWLWAAAAVAGLGVILFLIRQLMRLALEWPPRLR